VIQETCGKAATSVGVDLSFEDRKARCLDARTALQRLCGPLMPLQEAQNTGISSKAEQMQRLLVSL
jgi:hypothetical protein